jgi:hypothetical protein
VRKNEIGEMPYWREILELGKCHTGEKNGTLRVSYRREKIRIVEMSYWGEKLEMGKCYTGEKK